MDESVKPCQTLFINLVLEAAAPRGVSEVMKGTNQAASLATAKTAPTARESMSRVSHVAGA